MTGGHGTYRGKEIYTSITHWNLAMVSASSGAFCGEMQNAAAMMVFTTPPDKVMWLEALLHENRQAFVKIALDYRESLGFAPASGEAKDLGERVDDILKEIEASRDDFEQDGDPGEAPPGKPGAAPGTPAG